MGRLYSGPAPSRSGDLARMQETWNLQHPGNVSARWYAPANVGSIFTGTSVAPGAGRWTFLPVYFRKAMTITGLALRVTTALGTAKFAIYADDPTNHKPIGAPLLTSADVSALTAGIIQTATNGFTYAIPAAGWYWLAVCFSSTTVATAVDPSDPSYAKTIGAAAPGTLFANATTLVTGIQFSGSYTTPPTLTSGSAISEVQNASTPFMMYQSGSTG